MYNYLEFNDSLEVFVAYCYMLWNGYFSVNKDYQYDSNRYIVEENFSLGIILGRGVCLENSYFLKDLYRCLGYNSIIIHNKINKLKIDEELIKRRIIKNELEKIGAYNHLCTLVKDDKYNFIYDPTNITCFNMTSLKRGKAINYIGSMKIDIDSNFYTELEKINLNNILKGTYYNKKYNKTEILEKMKMIIKRCNYHNNDLNTFYLENEEYMKKIVKELKAR